jgi:O-antigen/teichoic acid export membrane protein
VNSSSRLREIGGASIANRIGTIVGSNALAGALTIVQGIALARLLEKAEFGRWSLAMVLLGTGRDLSLLSLPESILYFGPTIERAELHGLVRQTMRTHAALGALLGAIFCALALAPSGIGDRAGHGAMLVLAVAAMTSLPAAGYPSAFVALGEHRAAARVAVVASLVQLAALVATAALGFGVAWMLAAFAAALAIRFALFERLLQRKMAGVEAAPFAGGIRAQLRYAAPLALTRALAVVSQRLDKLLVGLFYTASAFADVAVGARELPLVTLVPYSIAGLLLPELVRANASGGAREALALWHASIRKTALIMLPIAAFLLVASEPVVTAVYGARYAGAAFPFRIYTALLPLRVTAYGVMLMALGAPRDVLRAQVASLAVGVAAMPVLLHTVGVMGAPIATVVAEAFGIVYLLARIRRAAGVRIAELFPFRAYARVAVVAVIAALPLAIALRAPKVQALPPAVAIAALLPAFVALYALLAGWSGAMTREDRAFLFRFVRETALGVRASEPASAGGENRSAWRGERNRA